MRFNLLAMITGTVAAIVAWLTWGQYRQTSHVIQYVTAGPKPGDSFMAPAAGGGTVQIVFQPDTEGDVN